MRVGEILLEYGWVDRASLGRAITEQRHTGKRICSLLIARGLLDPDHAARALGEQHAVPAVLQRHLENRDRDVATLLPAALARTYFALPIGRNHDGHLIVVVRDPKPELTTVLDQAIGENVVVAVCAASQLEQLIDVSYDPTPSEEYEVDLSTGPRASIGGKTPTSLTDLGAITLVDLDDARVTRDFSQVPVVAVRGGSTLPPATVGRAPTTPPLSTGRPASGRPATSPPTNARITIDAAVAAIDDALSRDNATDVALRFAYGRWTAMLLLMIKEGAALGHRGHGPHLTPDAIRQITIPLAAPSIVKVAHDYRRIATEPPADAATMQERLVRMLGTPNAMAAPVEIASRVACVIVVGDPIGGGDPEADLEQLAEALGSAYTRVLHGKRT